jgi:NACalpha-BTF3-like transcription factor
MIARKGMSLAQAKKLARKLGVAVEGVHATGEVRFRFKHGRSVVVNNRKKDATRTLVTALRREQKAIQ